MNPLKRALDLSLAVPALCVAAPVIAVSCAAVRLSSPGPSFFVQTRVGARKRPFRVLKIRTMTHGADRAGPQVTAGADPRVTPVGKFLRRYKLDELPQLWNVLRGDMSIVGPRPEAERYVKVFRPEWDPVFSVRPGITDPASLAFRDEESLLQGCSDPERAYVEGILPEKIPLALEGVRLSSLTYDLSIIARTALAVSRKRVHNEHPAVQAARQRIRQKEQRA